MLLSEAAEGFLLALIADGYSENTVIIYRRHLAQLAAYLGAPDVAAISPLDILRFAAWLRAGYTPQRTNGDTSPYSPSSIANAWCAVRSFYRWAAATLGIERPDLGWQRPTWTRPEMPPFSQAELTALLKAAVYSKPAATTRRTSWSYKRATANRNVALILLLLDTGLRAGEAARLRVQDVVLETGEVYVMPFGSGRKTKSRHVYLGKASRKALWRYLAERPDRRPEDRLFTTPAGGPMDRDSLRHLLLRIGEAAGVTDCHPHRFRHTFAIQYLRNGGDVFTLQRILGHSTLDMVRRYLALADDDAANAHRTASPADRWRL